MTRARLSQHGDTPRRSCQTDVVDFTPLAFSTHRFSGQLLVSSSSIVVVRVGDLQPPFRSAVLNANRNGSWDLTELRRAVAHEFDFMGPWVEVSVSEAHADSAVNAQLTLRFTPPERRNFGDAEQRFGKAMRSAEQGKVAAAAKDLQILSKDWPEVAKYWKALGHTHLVLGNADECENALLKSLAIDPHDADAITLLGNLYARKGNGERAVELYRRSVELLPNVHALTNIAAILSKLGRIDEALAVFREAVAFDPKYANGWYGLGLNLANRRDEALLPESIRSFERALTLLNSRHSAPDLWDASQGMLNQLSAVAAQASSRNSEAMLRSVSASVESDGGLLVRIEEAALSGILAKIELGWVHQRDYHRIIVGRGAGIERIHQIRHELEHARLAALARKVGRNKWFASSQESFERASAKVSSDISHLRKLGYSAAELDILAGRWIDGINSQLYNFPIDLLIESTILREQPDYRELWFYALEKQLRVALQIAEDASIAKSTSQIIYRASNAMNGAFALWFEDQFPHRTDIVERFQRKATFSASRRLYSIWQKEAADWKPGAEFAWVDLWATELGLAQWYVWLDGNGDGAGVSVS